MLPGCRAAGRVVQVADDAVQLAVHDAVPTAEGVISVIGRAVELGHSIPGIVLIRIPTLVRRHVAVAIVSQRIAAESQQPVLRIMRAIHGGAVRSHAVEVAQRIRRPTLTAGIWRSRKQC